MTIEIPSIPYDEWEQEQNGPEFNGLCLTLDQWNQRKIMPKDFLLGEVFSTTTRAILSAETGLGKTHFGFASGFSMAAGVDFCHWKAHREARVLLIDGEMAADLVKERLADSERRIGQRPHSLFVLCNEDVSGMPPLDTVPGQRYIEWLISHLGGVDFIIFDNIMSLTVGDLKDEEKWRPIVEWNRSLTKKRIGTFWINHTGHDKSRDYGTSTRIWQMDTAMVAIKLEDCKADIAFKLEFTKARQRKPSNRADYETVNLILENDQWRTEAAKPNTKAKQPGKNQKVLLNCLDTVLATSGEPSPKFTGMASSGTVASYNLWQKQCLAQLGQSSERRRKQAFEEAAEALIGDAIGKHNDYIWRIY
jgi:RecA-family ATPase